ncbi:alkylmercury lyase family protein [Streptomyces sp. ICN988]|uniref:alkylmercury lyase family protein n=1 Tax=Streptomyces sp. ICN988 TaxID=2983765 RepID=UPI0021E3CEBE|nr:alkylmercury lyase family protein [Streptomyces sp. ICN988]MCV2458209.1 alkylmercury lyase family protein [Streptomyces sp. ICN988]
MLPDHGPRAPQELSTRDHDLSFSALLPQSIDAVARGGIARSQAQLVPALRAVHQALLREFLTTGRGPRAAWVSRLALRHGLEPGPAVEALAHADLVHLNSAGHRVEIAYPLSAARSPHRVTIQDGPPLNAMCAIDALGIPLMAGTAATVVSRDPGTGRRIRVTRDRDGSWNWEPATTVVVLATTECAGPIAGACQHTEFHAAHDLGAHHLSGHPQRQGHVLTQDQALAIAKKEFGPLLGKASR